MVDALRRESDCILIARPDAVSDLDPVITETRYVLTPHTVPFNRFCGMRSLIDRAWLEIPNDGELSRMNNYKSDVDIAMHIGFTGKRRMTMNKTVRSGNALIMCTMSLANCLTLVAKFLDSFRQAKAEKARPVRDIPTPNDRSRGPPKTSDDERTDRLRAEVSERFRNSMKKAVEKQKKTLDVSSLSESESMAQPVMPIQAKARPTPPTPPQRQQKSTAKTDSSAAASGSCASASRPAESSARDERRKPVKSSAAKRETSTRAKELFKDADAAKKVFTKFKREFDDIEWFQRPDGPQFCKNFDTCQADNAMFWCHPCGFAYCLQCRVRGDACDHHIINYSSEISSEFMTDSISSKDSPFDVGEIIDDVLAESAYFGATRSEQAQTRKECYDDFVFHLKNGKKLGNSYLQSFIKHGIEDYDFAGFIYKLDGGNRVPTLQEHFLDAQDAAALPIWRPEIFFKYPEGPDLSEEETEGLLELFRSCLMGKRAVQGLTIRTADNIHETQKDSYQLGILILNLGHVNRHPYIGGTTRFPSWVRKDNQYRCLPYLVFRHSAHISCLCEASDEHGGIALHQQVARDHGMIGMVVHPEIISQSVAIFLIRGDHSVGTFIELLGHFQCETEHKQERNQFWLLDGAIFRLAHGRNTSGEFVNPNSGVRMAMPNVTPNETVSVKPHPAPLATPQDSKDCAICEIDGKITVQQAELLPVASGADTHDVKRLGLAETRIAVFNISSYAWTDAYAEACQKWLSFIASCIEHQCDFLSGDGNQFAQRSFKKDEHSDYRTSIMIDILERFLQQINLHRNPINRITYNVVSSTMASEYIRSMEGENANCDSMILISL